MLGWVVLVLVVMVEGVGGRLLGCCSGKTSHGGWERKPVSISPGCCILIAGSGDAVSANAAIYPSLTWLLENDTMFTVLFVLRSDPPPPTNLRRGFCILMLNLHRCLPLRRCRKAVQVVFA